MILLLFVLCSPFSSISSIALANGKRQTGLSQYGSLLCDAQSTQGIAKLIFRIRDCRFEMGN